MKQGPTTLICVFDGQKEGILCAMPQELLCSLCILHHSNEATNLHVDIHGQVVAVHARMLPPYVGSNGAEQAHAELHGNDESNLQIQEAVIGPCKHRANYVDGA